MPKKKKILILSSFGGYGHIAAANTLDTLLSREYEMEVIYPIKEIKLWKVPHGEGFYNYLLSNNMTSVANWVVRNMIGPMFIRRQPKMEGQIYAHIQKMKPDIVISLIPLVNYPASEAARKADIPFLLITTDNDLTNWAFSLRKKQPARFKATIGASLPTTIGIFREENIFDEEMEVTGLPLRPEFLDLRDKAELRKEYEISMEKPVVLLMMGGVGARLSYQYLKALAKSINGVHFIVCAGRNKGLTKRLEKIEPLEGSSIQVVPFTEKVHELFALSDLIVTKPGPGTINEAICCKLPILVDKINTPLFWEEANIDLVCNSNIGSCVSKIEEVAPLVKKYLFDEQTRETVIRAYKEMPKNHFASRIKPMIQEMIEASVPGELVMTSRSSLS